MSFGNDEINLDEKKLNRMKVRILSIERDNLNTRIDTEGEMIDKVRKIIEEEAKKCF